MTYALLADRFLIRSKDLVDGRNEPLGTGASDLPTLQAEHAVQDSL